MQVPIQDWLVSQNINPEYVSIINGEDDVVSIQLESEEDPTSILEAYPRTITPKEELAEALDDLNLEEASVEELKTAVILLRALVTQ